MSSGGIVPLTLELLGSDGVGEDVQNLNGNGVTNGMFEPIGRRVQTATGCKIQVLVPRQLDGFIAQQAAELLLSGMEEVGGRYTVDRVQIGNIRFTDEGVASIMMFMAVKAPEVRHLHIRDVIELGTTPSEHDKQVMGWIALGFQDSRLETLDLSYNVVGAHIWDAFMNQTHLQSLHLEEVYMDDDSLEALAIALENDFYANGLSKLCISNQCSQLSTRSVQAGNSILLQCTRLRHLRWAHLPDQDGNRVSIGLPSEGLNRLVQRMNQVDQSTHLIHLELEGGSCTEQDFDPKNMGLCGALQALNSLTHLTLRDLELSHEQVWKVLQAIRRGHVPLQEVDFSGNRFGDKGAESLTQIVNTPSLSDNLKYLSIEDNDITDRGATTLFQSLSATSITSLDIRTDGNPLNMAKVALIIAASKNAIENENVSMRNEIEQLLDALQDAKQSVGSVPPETPLDGNWREVQPKMIKEIEVLTNKVEKLEREKNTLAAAFRVVGEVGAEEERNKLLDRITKLEEKVYSQPRRSTRRGLRRSTVGTGEPAGGDIVVRRRHLDSELSVNSTPSRNPAGALKTGTATMGSEEEDRLNRFRNAVKGTSWAKSFQQVGEKTKHGGAQGTRGRTSKSPTPTRSNNSSAKTDHAGVPEVALPSMEHGTPDRSASESFKKKLHLGLRSGNDNESRSRRTRPESQESLSSSTHSQNARGPSLSTFLQEEQRAPLARHDSSASLPPGSYHQMSQLRATKEEGGEEDLEDSTSAMSLPTGDSYVNGRSRPHIRRATSDRTLLNRSGMPSRSDHGARRESSDQRLFLDRRRKYTKTLSENRLGRARQDDNDGAP